MTSPCLLAGEDLQEDGRVLADVDNVDIIQGESKKKWDLKNNGHNSSEIHQKGKKLVCFGKFSINAARQPHTRTHDQTHSHTTTNKHPQTRVRNRTHNHSH